MADDVDVSVKFGADTKGAEGGAKDVANSVEELKAKVESISDTFRHLGELIGISFSVAAIKNFIESMATLGQQTEDTMARLGIGAETVGELSGVAKLTGGTMEGLRSGIERISLSIQKNQSATSPATAALKALGLNAKDLIGLPADQYFIKLADAVSKFNPSLNLTNALMAIGGRGIASMIPLLSKGGKGFKEMEEEVRKTGDTLTNVQAAGFEQTHEKLTLMGMSVEGLGIRIFTVLKPAIDWAVQGITTFIQSIDAEKIRTAALSVSQWTVSIIQIVGNFALDIGGIIDGVLAKFGDLGTTLKRAGYGAAGGAVIGSLAGGVGAVPGAVIGGAGAVTLGQITDWFAGVNQEVGKGLLDTQRLKAQFDKTVQGFGDSFQLMIAKQKLTAGLEALHPGAAPSQYGDKKLNAPGLDIPSPPNAFETALADSGKQLAALKAQTVALKMGTAEGIAYTEEEKLRAIATAANRTLTNADELAIKSKSAAIGAATVELSRMKAVQQSMQDLAQGITNAFMGWIDGTSTLTVAFEKLIVQMIEAVAQALILDIILSALGLAMPTQGLGAVFAPMFGGGKAEGGPLDMGKWYIAGEKGPEPIWGGGPGAFAAG